MSGGVGAPAAVQALPPIPVTPQGFADEDAWTEVSDFDLASIGHTRIGPDRFASHRGGTRNGAELLDLLSFRPVVMAMPNRGSGDYLDRLEAAQLQAANNRRSRGLPPKDLRSKKQKAKATTPSEVNVPIANQPAKKVIKNLDTGAEVSLDTQAAKAKADKEKELNKRRGHKATIKTGPLGIVDPAPIRFATLLGG